MAEKFHAYCFDKDGYYGPYVTLTGPEEVFNYCELQKHLHHEIRVIVPDDDAIVVQVVQGQYIFPEEWKRFNTNQS
jgi:hypothetical protein